MNNIPIEKVSGHLIVAAIVNLVAHIWFPVRDAADYIGRTIVTTIAMLGIAMVFGI